jgi:hypothetical protein
MRFVKKVIKNSEITYQEARSRIRKLRSLKW